MTTHSLYGGDIQLEFGRKRGSKGRMKDGYWIDDKEVVRVTSVGVPMPFAPACWYGAGLGKAKFNSLLLNLQEQQTDVLLVELEDWGEQIRKAAGDTTLRDRGTEGHRVIQQIIEGGEFSLPKDFEGLDVMLDHWQEWWDDNEIKIHAVEKKVYSKEFDYAGTCDLDATINGMRSIVDWKFGKIRTARIQVAAYAHARTEELGILYDQRMVVSVTEDGIKTEIYEDQEEDFGVFLDLLKVHRTMASW